MKKIIFPFVCIALFFSGCTFSSDYMAKLTSGEVGCSPSEIKITDLDQGYWPNSPSTWTATCGEEKYYCTSVSGGERSTTVTSCKK